VRDQAIVYDDIASLDELPKGWTDEQDGGRYRLVERDDDALFGYAVGPHSWKAFLHPPVLRLWRAKRDGEDVEVVPEPTPDERYAFIGVRACELNAIAIQDRVFLGGAYVDPDYKARREGTFIVAVNCGVAGGTCFCVSMETGPKAEAGFDLALTEIAVGGERGFVVEAGSDEGRAVLAELPRRGGGGRRRRDGPRDAHRRPAGDAVAQSGAPALGRGGRALPHLR
jgi:sulfhydrogenase subunit beta (sulfur reductase)